MAGADASSPDPISLMRSRQFVVLLVLAAIVGVVASLAAWGFLELVKAGLGPTPLVIVGVVVAYMVTLVLAGPPKPEPAGG